MSYYGIVQGYFIYLLDLSCDCEESVIRIIQIKHIQMTEFKEQISYRAPETEIIEIIVEGCLASSLEDPIESPEKDW